MFKRILFPTDFSEEAKTELSCMTSIPGIREIILFHVIRAHPMPMAESLAVQAAENYLRMAEAYIAALNPDIRVTLEEKASPDITGAIIETAEEHRADLIVIHATMKGIVTGVLFSHVSSKVLCRTSKINVMIMPDKLVDALIGKTYEKYCPMIFSRILCPTNFSEFSVKTTALAGTIKGAGEIILLHVTEESEGERDPAMKTAELRINEVRDRLASLGVKARTIVVTGKPETEIPRIAQEEDASLIWMRSAAQGCLHDFFFGSMVHDVIMNSTRPVIVIRSYT
ncbi:MAG: universal stress protein [Methanoregula sp.]|nr:universal stress protein [Methanoregula sp.]